MSHLIKIIDRKFEPIVVNLDKVQCIRYIPDKREFLLEFGNNGICVPADHNPSLSSLFLFSATFSNFSG